MTPQEETQQITDEQMRQITIGELKPHDAPVTLVPYDPKWPYLFNQERERIEKSLGKRALMIEHVGSTSVPGLAAKAIIDILLVVPDSSDESSYVPELEKVGYVLRIREPDWHQHRLFKGPGINLNLHVFSEGSSEIERMLLLRDWLRNNEDDRRLYAETKKRLSAQKWHFVQHYAEAKGEVVEAIISRAQRSTPKP